MENTSHGGYSAREGGRHYSDPTTSRFNPRNRYHHRGGPNSQRPVRDRRPTGGDDVSSLTVSIGRNFGNGRHFSHNPNPRRQNEAPSNDPQRSRIQRPTTDQAKNQRRWWRISISQAGVIGKERVMTTLKAHSIRQFQPYHYFVDRDTNAGIFFVNSQEEADMLRRLNRKVDVQNLGILNIMVSSAMSPAPLLDEDLRRHFRDFIVNHRFNPQTFQLNLSNLLEDQELSDLGIYPQLNKTAIVLELVNIINQELQMTRQLDLGSNHIANLNGFRNLNLIHLEQMSLASNDLKSVEELINLQQMTRLAILNVKNNPFSSPNNRKYSSRDQLISAIRSILPQLRRIDDEDLPAQIGFGVDQELVNLPASKPHCVPQDMQAFLGKFIDEYYRLFDTNGRVDLHACYHDSCFLSICVSPTEGSIVPTKSYKFGPLIYDSRNLKKLADENKRTSLLRRGKSSVLDFLRVRFPSTKHDGTSFRVDVISTSSSRAIFTVHGLYREVEHSHSGPVRSFQRVFTCLQTTTGVLIVSDHLMIINATEVQYSNMARSNPPPTTTSASAQHMDSQAASMMNNDDQNTMVLKFCQESRMNYEFSRRCLLENNWNYPNALRIFLDLKSKNLIPIEAFK